MSDMTVKTTLLYDAEGLVEILAALAKFGAGSKQAQVAVDAFGRKMQEASRAAQTLIPDETVRKSKQLADNMERTAKAGKDASAGTKVNLGTLTSAGAGLVGGGAGQLLGVINDIEGLVGSLGKISLPAIAAAGAIGAMAAVFATVQESASQAAAAAAGAVKGVQSAQDLIVKGTSEQARQAIEAAEMQIRSLEKQRQVAQSAIDQFGREAGAVGSVLKVFGALGTDQIKALEDQIKQTNASIAGQIAQIATLTDALDSGTFAEKDAAEAKKKTEEATKSAVEAERALTEERLRADIAGVSRRTAMNREALALEESGSVSQIQARIQDIARERELLGDQIAQLNKLPKSETVSKEIERLRNEMLLLGATATKLSDQVLAAARAREAEAAALQKAESNRQIAIKALDDYQNTLSSMAQLQAERTKALEDEKRALARAGIESGLERDIEDARERQRIRDVERDYQDQANKANIDYLNQQRKAQGDYQRDSLRSEEDFGRTRARLIEDLNTDLLDLVSTRDVAGFIRRQRQGTTDLNRGAEDFGVDSRRRMEDFNRQRAEETAAREAQLADMRKQFEASRVMQVTEADRLQKQLTDLRARWAEDDRVRLHNEREKSYQDQLNQLRRFAQQAVSTFAQMVSAVQLRPTTRGGSAFGPVLTANAEGGIYNQPTMGLLGEKPGWMDFVLPVRQGEGINKALERVGGRLPGGGREIIYHDARQIVIGDVASRNDVERALAADRREMLAGLKAAVS